MRSAKNRSITATGNRCRPFCGLYVGRGALPPPRGVWDATPYSGEPRTFPLWQTSAAACGQAALRIARKEVIPPGTIATLKGPGMPGPRPDGKRLSAGTTPGGYRIRPYGKSLPPPTVANRGRTSRKPIFQQQPPPVVENFPGGRRVIVRK